MAKLLLVMTSSQIVLSLLILNLLQNCYAEIIPKSGSHEALIYRSVGAEGRVDITAEDPGVWGQIYPYHHPVLCKSCDF